MTWTYSGDPSTSEVDKYRFLIGDTQETEPILQDGEIAFVLAEYSNHNSRLFHLYDAAAQFFARKIKRKVGPIEEEPLERQMHFEKKAAYYKALTTMTGLSLPVSTSTVFTKGIHDND